MPQPGWYDDPDGTPQRLRWWDGTRWTDHTHGESDPVAGASTLARGNRGGPWLWVGLGLVGALVATVVFGVVTGLLRLSEPDRGVPEPPRSPSSVTSATQASSASPRPSVSQLPSVPARTGGPVVTPTPMPSIPPEGTLPDDGCPRPTDPTLLTDGQVALTIPATWARVDSLTWLGCGDAAASTTATASVTLGLFNSEASTPQQIAEEAWATALLDAGLDQALTQVSSPVRVQDMQGWMISGTVAIEGELDELTVIVIDAGEYPTVLVTSTASVDEGESRVVLSEILSTVRRA